MRRGTASHFANRGEASNIWIGEQQPFTIVGDLVAWQP
jgi:hypothetical protein